MTDISVDIWSGWDHKLGMGPDESELSQAPPYVKEHEDVRRINFYRRAVATLETVGRYYLRDPEADDLADRWREYGDPGVFVERVAAGVLGEDPAVIVVGADDPVPDDPELPEEPEDPTAAETEDDDEDVPAQSEAAARIAAEVYALRSATWEQEASEIVKDWAERVALAPRLKGRQRWLHKWAEDADLIAKLVEMESEHVVPLGSGVLTLGWDAERGRVNVDVHSPEWYYPVLSDTYNGSFPTKVHIAWPLKRAPAGDPTGEKEDWVRRKTWELVRLDSGELQGTVAKPAYITEGEQVYACLFSEGLYKLDDFENVLDFPENPNEWVKVPDPANPAGEPIDANRLYIGLDFIPVVHVPNTLNRAGSHFGRSILTRLVQLFDQIAETDTGISLAGEQAAEPTVFASGLKGDADTLAIPPGTAVSLREGGRIGTIDMGQNLPNLLAMQDENHLRASVVGQVPQGLLGRIDAKDVPSGIAYVLSFTPFKMLITKLRLARETAYNRLLLKFVQRIAIAAGDPTLEGADVFPAQIRFGAFMPEDRMATANEILTLRQAKAVSQETSVKMAAASGTPSGDLDDEMASIRAEMADIAEAIFNATGSTEAALRFLGLDADDLGDIAAAVDDEAPVNPTPAEAALP